MSIFNYFFYFSLDDGSYGEGVVFLNVFVRDELLREYSQGLRRLDYVDLTGTLGYHLRIDKDGKKRYNGFILADRLSKIIPIDQQSEIK